MSIQIEKDGGVLLHQSSSRAWIVPETTKIGALVLSRPLEVLLQWDENGWVASASGVDTYGVGETEDAAISDFLVCLALDYQWFVGHRETLAPRLLRQFGALTSLIHPAAD